MAELLTQEALARRLPVVVAVAKWLRTLAVRAPSRQARVELQQRANAVEEITAHAVALADVEAIRRLVAERSRQIDVRGFTPEDDDTLTSGELAAAAAAYALPAAQRAPYLDDSGRPACWPWFGGWEPTPEDRVRELVKAGALIVAEIDRLHRLAARTETEVPRRPAPEAPEVSRG